MRGRVAICAEFYTAKRCPITSLTSNRGAALVTALLAMLVLSTVGLMISTTVAEDVQVARNHFEIVSCLYISEAGLDYAMAKIEGNPSWPGLPAPGRGLAGGYFTVEVSDSTTTGTPAFRPSRITSATRESPQTPLP